MNPDMVLGITTKTLEVALLIAAPMLIFGLIAGLIVSIFQAVTQIQEMTLTFIPKILAVILAMVIFFPWMMDVMISFTVGILTNINSYIGNKIIKRLTDASLCELIFIFAFSFVFLFAWLIAFVHCHFVLLELLKFL